MSSSLRITCALAFAVLCDGATAQTSRNVELLSTLKPALPNILYSDVWGYLDPATGKEYALLLSRNRIHVIDCSDPRNPVQTGSIPSIRPGIGNTWRDCKTFGPYAYVVSEAHEGMQIIDLSDPQDPQFARHWGQAEWHAAHNLAIDTDTGLAYACGTERGTVVVDLNVDPLDPTVVHTLATPYIHDLSVRDGFGFLADLFGNGFLVYDVTQLPAAMPLVGAATMPGGGVAHSTWPTRDNLICLGANEWPGGPVSIFETTNKMLPRLISTYQASPVAEPNAVPHNTVAKDRVGHIAYFTEGYRAVDLSSPPNPVEVGYYDTFPGALVTGQEGAWGVYHGQPSGVIYVSDTVGGLFVLKPKATVERYGQATAGSRGSVPEIYAFGAPYLGNARFKLQVENAPPDRPGLVLLGAGRSSLVVAGVPFHVPLSAPAPVVLGIATNAAGKAELPLPMPTSMLFNGAVVTAQFLIADSVTALFDFSATQGVEATVFAR